MRVEINEESLKKVEANVRKAFDNVVKSKEMMNEIGSLLIQDIRFETRRGNSIPFGSKLKPLKDSTIKTRKYLDGRIRTGDAYSPRRSNLTMSGQLLDSLSYIIEGAGKIAIKLLGTRQPYTPGSRPRANAEVGKYVAEAGRPFVGVTDKTKGRINKLIVRAIRRAGKVFKAFELK